MQQLRFWYRLQSRRMKLVKPTFFVLTVLMAATLLTFTFCGNLLEFGSQVGVTLKPANRNYFLSHDSFDALEFIVNTSGCKILDLDPWDSSIIQHIVKLDQKDTCRTNIPHWTYVNGTTVVINTTALKESGYNRRDLYCCYKTIEREEQDPDDYDSDADTVVRYSTQCYPMDPITFSIAEHIFVVCKIGYLNDELYTSVYKNFHIIALPNKRIQSTLKRWQKLDDKATSDDNMGKSDSNQIHKENQKRKIVERPPNVIMIGMDSTSRLNFRRAMFNTTRILQEIGAHEMLGYTKVGENTYPNAIPFLTGYNEYQMEDLCRYEKDTKLDECPYIWKNYKDADYINAEIEDSPRLAIFNYMKTGFVIQPTDLYTRPILLAAHQAAPGYPYSLDCLGYKTVDQFLLDYLKDVLDMAKAKNVPIFLMSWLTQLGHENTNSIQTGDKYYSKFLKSLVDDGLLENSVLLVMSDHGYRFGAFRNTISGWYEDKLPNMWIRLSPNIIRTHPEWEEALVWNERQLTSPYDLYHTFVHILRAFAVKPFNLQEYLMRNGTALPRKYGQSFFKPLPVNRTCDGAGIPDDYCACKYPVKMRIDDPILNKSAQAAIDKINGLLPSQCVKFVLCRIEGGARLSSSSEVTNPSQYVIDFNTQPGEFAFEATVQRFVDNKFNNESYEVSGSVQRLSKINTDVGCIRDPTLQLYCFCETAFSTAKSP